MNAEAKIKSHTRMFHEAGTGEALLQGHPTKPDATPMDVKAFPYSPEGQILNVALSLVELVDSRSHNGKQAAIKSASKQLLEMLEKYFAGQLKPLPDDGLEF